MIDSFKVLPSYGLMRGGKGDLGKGHGEEGGEGKRADKEGEGEEAEEEGDRIGDCILLRGVVGE